MDKSIRQQYRVHLELGAPAPMIVEFTGENLDALKTRANLVLDGKGKFEGAQARAGSPGVTLVFHPNVNQGELCIGFISTYEVPEHLTVESTIERLTEAAA
jgi:hypothetical protein